MVVEGLSPVISASANYSHVYYDLDRSFGYVNVNFQASANMSASETTILKLPDIIKDRANTSCASPINIAGGHVIIRAGGEIKVYLPSASRPRIYGQVNFYLSMDS